MNVKVLALLLTIFLILFCSGCDKSMVLDDNTKEENEITKSSKTNNETFLKANNESDAELIIKYEYPEEAFNSIPVKVEKFIKEFPPECIRTGKTCTYFIYKSNKKHFWFVMLNDANDAISDWWYCGHHTHFSDFTELYKNKASVSEVERFDPYGIYNSFYMGYVGDLVSLHYTADGELIELKYDSNRMINGITITNSKLYDNLISTDKELWCDHFMKN